MYGGTGFKLLLKQVLLASWPRCPWPARRSGDGQARDRGAWDIGPFGNDTAADFGDDLPDGEPACSIYGPSEPMPEFRADLRRLAADAMDQVISGSSELAELWGEAVDGPKGRTDVIRLRDALTSRSSHKAGSQRASALLVRQCMAERGHSNIPLDPRYPSAPFVDTVASFAGLVAAPYGAGELSFGAGRCAGGPGRPPSHTAAGHRAQRAVDGGARRRAA
ncbi:DUF4259 domain-containing protein [Streptomyces sp. NPDC048428]|uniref:DUF4259 domain-containing protein n=1 Tax=Streptomyces sp. NPDC048428 TaxID=3154503 RepID=UPI003432B4F9